MNKLKLLGMLAFMLVANGCAVRYYPLPLPASEAHVLYPSIYTVAKERGFEAWHQGDAVQVNTSKSIRLDYKIDPNNHFAMWVTLFDKKTAEAQPGGVEGALASARALGEELFTQAIELRRRTAPTPQYDPIPQYPTGYVAPAGVVITPLP